jgi:hypothetical protein
MKKRNLTLALVGLLIGGAIIISSCKKKDSSTAATSPPDTNASTASDNNMVEQNSNDAENIAAQANDNGSLSTFRLAGGASTMSTTQNGMMGGTVTTAGFGTGTITVTFNNYIGYDMVTRNGEIIITNMMMTNATHYRDPGMMMTITTGTGANVYTVNNNTVTINKTIQNTTNGIPSATNNVNMTWAITSTITINKASGGTPISWTASRTHTLLNTVGTYTLGGTTYAAAYTNSVTPITWANTATGSNLENGAIIEINGNSSGTSSDGLTFSASSTNVICNMNCAPFATVSGGAMPRPNFHPFCSGTVNFTPQGKQTRIINYGTGGCSTTYTISIGSWSETLSW